MSKRFNPSYYYPNEIFIHIFEFMDELDYLNIRQVDKQFYVCVDFILNSRISQLDTMNKLTQYLFTTHNCVSFVRKFIQINQKSIQNNQKSIPYFPASALTPDLPDEKTAYIYSHIAKYLEKQSIPPGYNDRPKTLKILFDHFSENKIEREIYKAITGLKPTKKDLREKISEIPKSSKLKNSLIDHATQRNICIIIAQCFKYYPELISQIDLKIIYMFSRYLKHVNCSYSRRQWIEFCQLCNSYYSFSYYSNFITRKHLIDLPERYFDIIPRVLYREIFCMAIRYMKIPLIKYLINKDVSILFISKIDISAKPTREIIDLLFDRFPNIAYIFYDHALIANDLDTLNYLHSKNSFLTLFMNGHGYGFCLISSRNTYIHIEKATIDAYLLYTGVQPEIFIEKFEHIYNFMSVETLELIYNLIPQASRVSYLNNISLLVWPHLLGLNLLTEYQIMDMYKMYKTKSKEKEKILAEFISFKNY